MKKKIKAYLKQNKKNIITITITLIITFIMFIPLLVGHYATDTYNIYNLGYKEFVKTNSFPDGRIFTAIALMLANMVNMQVQTCSSIMLIGAIIISNIAVIILKNIIESYKPSKNVKQQILVTTISYISIFNFMYLDNLYFLESGIMALSVLLYIISAKILVEKNSKYLLKSILLTIFGVMCYQGTIGLFFTYVFLFSILKNKNDIKQIIKDVVQSGIIAVISIVFDLLLVKIAITITHREQSRYGKISNILTNIVYIIGTLGDMLLTTCNIFPKGVFFIYLIFLILVLDIYVIKNQKENIFFQFLGIIVMTMASAYVVNLTTLSSFDTGRLKTPYGALIGIIFMFIYVQTDIFDKKKIYKYIITFTLITFTIINIFNYESIMIQHKNVNKIEKQEARQIEEYIKEYEKETNVEVSKIARIIVKNNGKGIPNGIKTKSDFGRNALRTTWGIKGALQMYENRCLIEKVPTDDDVDEYKINGAIGQGYECIGDTFFINIYNY